MNDLEHKALLWAEHYGIIDYEVKGEWMVYWSFFGGEGFYKVKHNIVTGEEIRKHYKTHKGNYNYFTG